ncbi:uncharacterized protein B0I36DRAFT_312205 [Microdochium trichocladiopsis]|uniref:DUF2423 domain-containing protein n=1 Tax=Microdochium trichocladiopsis TaxID=1682393 RepID=A0A9P8YG75_9PEZI|nr:uncharacterized protein B0I36DRAFT_312205 [Microdochium trichocladiopsis]KAH7041132.1 hypothetical protein B0I36DRAFT_312205 [Microdochium trichocladiopsis]
MAKSSRSSTRKANNQRLKANVFGPVESARAERLSAKLLEIAAQPKPTKDDDMKVVDDVDAEEDNDGEPKAEASMDVDATKPAASSSSSKKNRVSKRRKTSKIVFPKYKDRRTTKKGKN